MIQSDSDALGMDREIRRMVNGRLKVSACIFGIALANSALAEGNTLSLADYLHSMDKTEVQFSGNIDVSIGSF